VRAPGSLTYNYKARLGEVPTLPDADRLTATLDRPDEDRWAPASLRASAQPGFASGCEFGSASLPNPTLGRSLCPTPVCCRFGGLQDPIMCFGGTGDSGAALVGYEVDKAGLDFPTPYFRLCQVPRRRRVRDQDGGAEAPRAPAGRCSRASATTVPRRLWQLKNPRSTITDMKTSSSASNP
jgi:hypothetical protein